MSLQSTATCNCGSVKVTIQYAEGQDLPSVLCHCENCIKSSGSVGAQYLVLPRAAVTVDGQLTSYMDNNCESGNTLERRFCGVCGSPVMAYSQTLPEALCIVRATMVSAPVRLRVHAYYRNAPEWMPQLDGVAVFQGAYRGEKI